MSGMLLPLLLLLLLPLLLPQPLLPLPWLSLSPLPLPLLPPLQLLLLPLLSLSPLPLLSVLPLPLPGPLLSLFFSRGLHCSVSGAATVSIRTAWATSGATSGPETLNLGTGRTG